MISVATLYAAKVHLSAHHAELQRNCTVFEALGLMKL